MDHAVSRLGWLNTYFALIVPWLASVFGIFFMRQAFATIPQELQDAATMDGASHLTFLRRVVVPLSAPVLITVGLLTFMGSWNSLTWPLIVTNTPEMRPVMVGLLSFSSEWGTQPRLRSPSPRCSRSSSSSSGTSFRASRAPG